MTKFYSKMLMVFMLGLLITAFNASAQVTIAEWTFDNETLLPATGTGTAENIGGTTTGYATGDPGRAWNTTTYPEQGTGSGTAGVQFNVSTAGYNNISVSWINRMSNTAANMIRLQYTVNGSDWTDFEASEENATNTRGGNDVGFNEGRYMADTGVVWYVRTADFSGITAVENNPQFAVRFVTEFADGANYAAANPTSSYGTSGTVRFDNVLFTGGTGTSPLLTSNPGNLSGFFYIIDEGPSSAQMINISGNNLTPESGDITVAAPASYEVSLDGANFSNVVTISYSGGTFEDESIAVRLIAGLDAGIYNETLTITGGGAGDLNIMLSGNVSSGMEPALGEVILPRYIQGSVPSNSFRVPYAWHATLINLNPNATYRYYNRVVLSSEGETATGAGNIILVNTTTKTFTRLTNPNLGVDGSYGEFTTDENGSYAGWFMTEPTGNATRFIPGNNLYMRIILNDGNNGTQPATFLTTQDSVTVINFGTGNADTTGTGFVVTSSYTEKNFALVYHNADGTGRPLFGTQIESSGVDFAGSGTYAAFYTDQVAGHASVFGGIVPNNLSSGIQRFEERSITDGSIVNSDIALNGIWPENVNTQNPAGGAEEPLFIKLTLGLPELTAETGRIYTYGNTLYAEFNRTTRAVLEIIDLQGRLTQKIEMNGIKESYPLTLPTGLYLMKVSTPEGVFTKKIYLK